MNVRELIMQLSLFPDNLPVHFVNEDQSSYPALQRVELYGRMVILDCHLIKPLEPEIIKAFDGNEYIVERRPGKTFVDYKLIK